MNKLHIIKLIWNLVLILSQYIRITSSEEQNMQQDVSSSLESAEKDFNPEHNYLINKINFPEKSVDNLHDSSDNDIHENLIVDSDENVVTSDRKNSDDSKFDQIIEQKETNKLDETDLISELNDVYESQVSICENNPNSEGSENCDKKSQSTIEENSVYDDESSDITAELPSLQFVGERAEQNDENNLDEVKDLTDQADDIPKTKQRVFPLLYTFRTLFTSFLAEFAEDHNQETSRNLSSHSQENMTSIDLLDKEKNTTINGTDSVKKTRFQCAPKNISENTTGVVKIVNSTELLDILNFSKKQKVSLCVLVLFYAPWCQFCAQTAPHYNALARAFPRLDVLAVDTSHFSYLNARFGTVAVPNIMLFHSRSAVRFNHSARHLDNFVDFVTNNTGMMPNETFSLEPFDEFGPLPSTVVRGRDWLLWLAWAFVLSCSGYGFVVSNYGQGVITRWRVLWQEHQHIE